jgi:hypothetical protein
MARKKDKVTPEDIVIILSRLPVWVGPLTAVLLFVTLKWIVPALLVDADLEARLREVKTSEIGLPVFLNGIGRASRMIAPWPPLVLIGFWGCAEFVKRVSRSKVR